METGPSAPLLPLYSLDDSAFLTADCTLGSVPRADFFRRDFCLPRLSPSPMCATEGDVVPYPELILLSRVRCDHQDRPVASDHLKRSLAARILTTASVFSIFVCLLFTAGCGITFNTVPLTVQPNSISFGDVAVGQTQTATVLVSNP